MPTSSSRDVSVQVYKPYESHLPPLKNYVRALWGRRQLVATLARTRLRSAHFNTVFGQFWTVLNPLLLAGVYFLLIQIIGRGQAGPARFGLLVGCIFLFYFTRDSVQGGARSIISGSGLILNTAFPRALLPITAVLESVFHLLPSLVIYVVIHLLVGAPITAALALMPLLLLIQLVFNVGVAMLIGTVGVYFRDIISALQYLTRVWLYVTPVIYTIDDLPDRAKSVLAWNPLFHLFVAYQDVLRGEWPAGGVIGLAAIWAVSFFVIGSFVFLTREREFAVRL